MPSYENSGQILGASLLQGSQAATSINPPQGGKPLPQSGNGATAAVPSAANPTAAQAAAAAKAQQQAVRATDPQSLVNLLNSHLNDSGRPDQFRVDPASAGKLIQQINPSNGDVVGEFSIDEFPALARSIGASGLIIDSLA
jgi:hypothetical protein